MTQVAAHFRTYVLAARERLAEGREKLRQRHQKGSPGVQVCRAQTELFDAIVLDVYQAVLEALGVAADDPLRAQVALVAHGGYGRGDVAPYSDVDLMILHGPEAGNRIAPLAERMLRDLFDVGLVLGQSVRTPKQACRLAREDAIIATSLVESRLLVGGQELFDTFTRQFARVVQRRRGSFLVGIDRARSEERVQFRDSVYLLEPNIKRSPGGLRDMQLLRWIGFARYGIREPDELKLQGALSHPDAEIVRDAWELLLRLRNELHYAAGKSSDVLDRVEQLRIAAAFGYQGTPGLLPVEQFMQEYFRRTHGVRDVVERFVAAARDRHSWLRIFLPLVSHRFERDFLVQPHQISANRHGLVKLRKDLTEVLRLADIANLYDKPISRQTCEAIRAAVPTMSDEVTPDTAKRFLSLLNQTARLGDSLRNLHEMGVLEKIVPAFRHARSLLQFNVYHKYTVDEHCLRAVDEATNFAQDRGPVGSVYKHLKRKWMLHLALLLHDLGKGQVEDHSDVGQRIAEEMGRRLFLSDADTETLKFLVHKHLAMSHLAFRRDTSDSELALRFAVEVGSPEVLEMLFVLTCADTSAVGPGVLNAWKVEVLADLFRHTMHHLGVDDPSLDVEARLRDRRAEVIKHLEHREDTAWYDMQLASLPASYLRMSPPAQIAHDLEQLRNLKHNEAVAAGRYQPDTGTVEYQVGTYEEVTPGIFHKLTGALSSKGLQILSAEIVTLAEGLVFDRFCVRDPDYAGEPPKDRIDSVRRALVQSLTGEREAQPFRRVWRAASDHRAAALSPLPTQVRVDNSTSDRYTILELFTADRMGLLHTITRTLFDLGLSVSVAKIGTHLDQVADVFYVSDQGGKKVQDEETLRGIRQRLLDEIERLAEQDNG